MPGLVLADLLISEGTCSVDPADLDFTGKIDRGELILPNGNGTEMATATAGRTIPLAATTTTLICVTATPRAAFRPAPSGYARHIHIAASDEHDEDGTLISDELPTPAKRRLMVEKRARKMETSSPKSRPPNSSVRERGGHPRRLGLHAGVIREAVREVAAEEASLPAKLQINGLFPSMSRKSPAFFPEQRVIIVENNYSASSPATCALKPASPPTAISANTTANPSAPITSSKPSKTNSPGKTDLSVPTTRSLSRPMQRCNHVTL